MVRNLNRSKTMAKRKAAKAGKGAKQETAVEEKARVELRLDRVVFDGLVKLSSESGISLNQLMQGLGRWAIRNGQPGEGIRDEFGNVRVTRQAGCVFFGVAGHHAIVNEDGDEEWRKGDVIFNLDFTERHVI